MKSLHLGLGARVPQRAANRSIRSVAQRPIRCQATPAGPGATGQSSSSPVAASSTTEDGATSALRQATVGLNSMVERLKERIQTLEDQLDRGRRSQKMAAEMRLALEAEAQEVGQLAIQANEAREATLAKLTAQRETVQKCRQEMSALQKLAEVLSAQNAAAEKSGEGKAEGEASGTKETVAIPSDGAVVTAAATVTDSVDDAVITLEEAQAQLVISDGKLKEAEARLTKLEARYQAMELASGNADEMAGAAMKAAEAAVADEVAKLASVLRLEGEVVKARTDLEKMLSALLKATGVEGLAGVEGLTGAPSNASTEAATTDAATAESPKKKKKSTDLAVLEAAAAASGMPLEGTEKAAAEEKPAGGLMGFLNKYKFALIAVGVVAAVMLLGPQTAIAQTLSAPFQALPAAKANFLSWMAGLGLPHIDNGMVDVLWLLAASIITVPAICAIPGGSPILGFLFAGAFLGPYALGLIQNLHTIHHLAELGVVFLMFNIGLELSLEKLQAMGKFVFGLGTSQVVFSLAAIAAVLSFMFQVSGPASIIIGASLALSSTAVALQVLQDRGESSSRHGRATFSVLLLQDLAVVVILMLIPLLAPGSGGGGGGLGALGAALGIAGVKAVACIGVIMAGGRHIVRPLFKKIAALHNPELFAATTLFICLGTSVLTQVAGLSMALGAFLAGLVIAETEYALQVESDIAPYKGLLLGLFFMTVGMEISPALLVNKWPEILAGMFALLGGKTLLMMALGPVFGLSRLQSLRAGLYLAPGGEFAFVALGDAVAKGLFAQALCSKLFLVVALTMAVTPYLAALGAKLGASMEQSDVKSLQPTENESDDLKNHVIICGFGRSGQLVAQLLSERLIPFVALDVRSDRVQAGRQQDLRVYFGDAGNRDVLHKVNAHHAACAVVTLDSPGSNYRTVWALRKHFPNVKIFARAHDINHGLNLEKAGATAVVPETLEPSLQLAAEVLGELDTPPEEIAVALSEFRRSHFNEMSTSLPLAQRLQQKAEGNGSKSSASLTPAPAH